jgi:hypothetical protein
MNVAKPPSGFRIIITPVVQAMVDDLLANHPELPKHWRAVIERLKASGHIAGEAVAGNPAQRAAIIQPFYNGPNIWLAWRVLGDTITIIRAQF